MKKNLPLIVLAILVIIIPIICYWIFLSNTRSIPKVEVIIDLKSVQGTSEYSISPESIKRMEDAVGSIKEIYKIDNLITVFEREREHYMMLITVITIILAVFSVFFIISRLVEKDDLEKMLKQFSELEQKYRKIKDDYEFFQLTQQMELRNNRIYSLATIVDQNNKPIDDFEKFAITHIKRLIKFIETCMERNYFDIRYKEIVNVEVIIYNNISGALNYAKVKNWINNRNFSTNDNVLYEKIIDGLKLNLKTQDYENIVNKIEELDSNIGLE